MINLDDSRSSEAPGPDRGAFRPQAQTVSVVLIVMAAVYLITNHRLHVLDALPYLGVVLVMSLCMFGHGSHGGHGGSHQGHGGQDDGRGSGRGAGHVH